ncbi:unnamed protein product [Rangifer tarandus platyrhynchus]|uniref:Uncharacterized protein n=1 Tax=Rangifer tarandus platyrhynchus TaxID=3082113 RepID=A0AC59ZUD7_RANTA
MNVARSYPKELHRRKSRNKNEKEPPDGSCPGAKGAPGHCVDQLCLWRRGVGGEKGHFFAKEAASVALRRWEIAWNVLETVNMSLGLQCKFWSGVAQAEFGIRGYAVNCVT